MAIAISFVALAEVLLAISMGLQVILEGVSQKIYKRNEVYF